jgi:inositol 2-dehydrogenase
MGQVYAHTLAFTVSEVDLVAVADSHPKVVQETTARYGIPFGTTDYRELLKRDDVEAVVIATPTRTHAEVIIEAARCGKQIFTEKPLGESLKACDDVTAAVKAAGVKMQVGFMRRYDAAYRLAKEKIDQGVIGTPVMFKAVGRDPKSPSLEFAKRANSGGLILDMGVHEFDLARWLMGSEVVRVHSEGGCLVFHDLATVGDIDNACVNLKFANGGVGNIDVSRNAVYGYDIRTEVIGSDGGLMIGYLQQTAVLVMTPGGICHDTVPYFMERFGSAYAEEVRAFVRCLVEDRDPQPTATDARAATAIGVAATMSLDEGRPVLLSELD